MKNQLNACISEKIKTQNEHEAVLGSKLAMSIVSVEIPG